MCRACPAQPPPLFPAGGLASLGIEIAPGAGPSAFPRSRTCAKLMWLPAYETQVPPPSTPERYGFTVTAPMEAEPRTPERYHYSDTPLQRYSIGRRGAGAPAPRRDKCPSPARAGARLGIRRYHVSPPPLAEVGP